MSGISYTMPRFQAIDQNGRPMVGATLYTYQNKTTTPHPTWKDKEQTAYNTNPIVLDARGEAVVWLDPEQVYTFVLRDWFGALVWSQDDVAGSASQIDLAAPDGSSMVGFIQAGAGAVPRTMLSKSRDIVNAKDFLSLQSAVNFALSESTDLIWNSKTAGNSGIVIDLGGQVYMLDHGLVINERAANITIKNGIIRASDSFPPDEYLLSVTGDESSADGLQIEKLSIENVVFDCKHRGGGVYLKNHFRVSISKTFFMRYASVGLHLDYGSESLEGSLDECYFMEYETGEAGYLTWANYKGTALRVNCSDFVFSRCVFAFSKMGTSLQGSSNTFMGCHWYGCGEYALRNEGSYAKRNIFSSCWINGRFVIYRPQDGLALSLYGCRLTHDNIWPGHSGPTWGYIIGVDLASESASIDGLIIDACTFDGAAHSSSNESLRIISGTVSASTNIYLDNNIYINGISELRHAPAGSLSTMSDGQIDSAKGALAVGTRAGLESDIYISMKRRLGAAVLDLEGKDDGFRASGVRFSKEDQSHWELTHLTNGNFRAEKRTSGASFLRMLELAAGSPATGDTALFVAYNSGAGHTFQRVTLGAPDSGGVGFRLLRVPN